MESREDLERFMAGDHDTIMDQTRTPSVLPAGSTGAPSTTAAGKKQFYGSLRLDPVKAKLDFATIVDEVIEQFTAKYGVDVSIAVEIRAYSKDGFGESLQRTVKENCTVLKFTNAEFEASDH